MQKKYTSNNALIDIKMTSKKTWNTIKEILNKNKNKEELPNYFIADDTPVSDRKTIADKFNKFFINIGPELSSKITCNTTKSFTNYLTNPSPIDFSFSSVNSDTIKQIINKLKPKTTSGFDKLSNKLLKEIKDEIAEPLSLIINQSINNGIFPDKLKIAKVIPIYKKGENNRFDNYRPISILPSVSKVFERVIHNQLHTFLTNSKIYYDSQYGFRKLHSTELATLELIDRILFDMDKMNLL
jgi:hypothetical protein